MTSFLLLLNLNDRVRDCFCIYLKKSSQSLDRNIVPIVTCIHDEAGRRWKG